MNTPTPFPFFNLPTETQLSILQYTDLVTPLSAVAWRPDWGFRLPRGDACCKRVATRDRKPCGPPYDQCHPSNHLNCTGRLKDPRTEWYPETRGLPAELPELRKPDDAEPFCPCPHAREDRRYHWVYWGECSRCQHYACQFMPRPEGSDADAPVSAELEHYRIWQPPAALFLVSRSFRDICSTVFYSRNHFHLEVPGPYGRDLSGNYVPGGATVQAAPTFLSRTVPASSISALRTLRIDFGNYEALGRYNDHHINPYNYLPLTKDMSQADELLKTDPVFTEYAKILQRTIGQLRVDTLTLTHSFMDTHLDHFGLMGYEIWKEMGPQAAVRLVRQVVASLYWPALKDHPLSILGGTGSGRGGSQRLIAEFNFGAENFSTPIYYVRRLLRDPVPISALMYHLGMSERPFWGWETGPHKVSDGEPVGPGEEGSAVVDEVFFA
ncbi:uncharacterized protein PG998_006545 [Apiospora kogelbergensis]|uniref:uncharacterized protein n=1 Tax=Apiospora kogelbergensis TaxID=1337665 RepID=UPI00312E3838